MALQNYKDRSTHKEKSQSLCLGQKREAAEYFEKGIRHRADAKTWEHRAHASARPHSSGFFLRSAQS